MRQQRKRPRGIVANTAIATLVVLAVLIAVPVAIGLLWVCGSAVGNIQVGSTAPAPISVPKVDTARITMDRFLRTSNAEYLRLPAAQWDQVGADVVQASSEMLARADISQEAADQAVRRVRRIAFDRTSATASAGQ